MTTSDLSRSESGNAAVFTGFDDFSAPGVRALEGSPKALTSMCGVAVSAFGGSGGWGEREGLPLVS